MRGPRVAVVLGLLLAVPVVLAAAGPAGAQAVKVKVGSALSPASLDSITPYVALERGLFRQVGLDVQIVEFRGSPTTLKALLAGEVDVSINMGGTDAIVAASKGAKIRLFVVAQPVTAYHFVARREAGTTLQALVGKNVAVSGIGAISYHIPRMVLERSGVDPNTLKYIAVGSPADRFKALVAGKVDAAVVTNTEVAKLAAHPEVLSLAQVAKVLPEILAKAYDMGDPRLWGVNGDITEAAYKFTVDFLTKVGYMSEPVPYEKFFDRRFVERVLKELGRM